jgi:uncharacterized protein YjbI with pentapeptide repeats
MILQQDVVIWNLWREENSEVIPDLEGADLEGANLEWPMNLEGADLSAANLKEADLSAANLKGANLEKANLEGANLEGASLYKANLEGADLPEANLEEASLSRARLLVANLKGANLSRARLLVANLEKANLEEADLSEANLEKANLSKANLEEASLSRAKLLVANLKGANLSRARLLVANLEKANLEGADLPGANLEKANLYKANLKGASLSKANLEEANLSRASLSKASLDSVNLQQALLIQTNLSETMLTDCRIFGISAWGVKLTEAKKQFNLRITPESEPEITVDNLEVAQFVYLLLHNEKIRNVIDTIGTKGVLILGRFTPERKTVLDAIRNKLRELGFVPMMFDFEKPTQRDFTETIKTLAGMSRFIIADITNPKSSPLELQATIPDYMIPFVPIIHEGEKSFSMFKDLRSKYSEWVLEELVYDSVDNLINSIEESIVRPALETAKNLRIKRAKAICKRHVKDYL